MASFVPDTDKQLLPNSVAVSIDGTDVTETVFNIETNKIIIPSITSAVSITAVAETIDVAYQPLLYIATRAIANGNMIPLPYYPNSNTKLVMDAEVTGTIYTLLYGIKGPWNAPSTTNPQFYFAIRLSTTANWGMAWGSVRQDTSSASAGLLKTNSRFTFVCDKGEFSYLNNSNATHTQTLTAPAWTTSGQSDLNLKLFGQHNTTSTYSPEGKIYRVTIDEGSGTLLDYIPVVRLSDNVCGLYDLVNGSFLNNTSYPNNYVKPFIAVARSLTNVTNTILSSAKTGTSAKAVIGETWSCKYTPSSGYTFNRDDYVFQVIINNEDVTREVATYDVTTDSWTVTLIAHWGDNISITASAVERLYDEELEWMQSDGSAYINTGIKITGAIRFDIDLEVGKPESGSYYYLFGGCTTPTEGNMRVYRNSNGNWAWYYGAKSSSISGVQVDKVRCQNLTDARHVYVNNGHVAVSAQSFTTNIDFIIYSIYYENRVLPCPPVKIYSAKLYDYNGSTRVLVRDYIPVKKDGVGYLYDKVSGQLFGNANSEGAFVCGPVKSYMNAIIPFEDAAVKTICVEYWGDSKFPNEITQTEAAAVTSLGGKFYNNQDITTFHELKYFTGLSNLRHNNNDTSQFALSTLVEATVPSNMTDLYRAFKNTRKIESLDLSNLTGNSINLSEVAYCTSTKGKFNTVTLPRAKVNLSGAFRYTDLVTLNADGSDWSDSPNFSNTFYNISTFKNITGTIIGINQSISFSACPLTLASATNILNGLSSPGSGKTCTFKASMQTTYEADADFNAAVTTATANGWTIAYS